MAKFLDGQNVQASLNDLIKKTRRELYLISPYLKIPISVKNILGSIDTEKIPISIIYRSDVDLNEDDKAFFNKLSSLKLYTCDNLHTKCFMNESMGIISTMNLHEHSHTHNWEMGIRFSKADDPEIFADVSKELHLMGPHLKIQTSHKKVEEPQQKYKATSTTASHRIRKPTEAPNKGILTKILDTVTGDAAYCIRCGNGISVFDLQKPYCDTCYASWMKYKNPKYKEKYCHGCGSDTTKSTISFEKPTCKDCFTAFYKK